MNVLINVGDLRPGAGPLRRLVSVIAVCLALTIALVGVGATSAWAGHGGSWTHHHNHVFEEGPSNYGGYADVDAADEYDYGAARILVSSFGSVIRDKSTTCGRVNEGCGYLKSPTVYWPQTSSKAISNACAVDTYRNHVLSGTGHYWNVCAFAFQSLPTHGHEISLS